jgi:hypothetical protein
MKKIIIFLSVFALTISCGKLEDLNKNIKDPASVPGETLFTGAQRRVFNQMVSSNVNLNNFRLFVQYWTETTYTDESNYDLTTRTTPDGLWDLFYINALKDFNESAKVITGTPLGLTEDPVAKQNKLAIIEVMEVYCYDVLIEAFGNIPYLESLDINKPLPKYDDGLTVYKDLLVRLDAAIGKMDDASESFGTADNMYEGNVTLWIKFANSLKLRMGLLLADKDGATAKTTVETAAPNVFSSNDDNAKLKYLGAAPNTNPIYIDLVASARHDFVPANTLVDSLNSLNDPRLSKYITATAFHFAEVNSVSKDSVVNTGIGRVFIFKNIVGGDSIVYLKPPYTIFAKDANKNIKVFDGGIYGASNDFLAYSHVADLIQTPTFPGTLFDYAEVEFLLAEAVERGYSVGGTAAEHYNNAITASIEDWGGTELTATNYLANPKVNYATAAGTWQQKIGIQSWLAYYNRGFEAWTQWRKLDYPLLQPPVDALSAIPLRYTYPIEEQTLNGANWASASTAIGGDAVDTKLFWDLH